MKKFFLIVFFGIYSMGLFCQRPFIELTYTAVNNTAHVRLDSIKVMNRTQGSDTVLYWPDTILSIYYIGIQEDLLEGNVFRVLQNYPNPVADQTNISLYVPAKDNVSILVTDILGRIIVRSETMLDRGKHSFRFTPGSGSLYFFTAIWQGLSSTIKILHPGYHSGGTPVLEHAGNEDKFPKLKSINDIHSFLFTPGDELLYIGYADILQSGIPDSPEESTAFTFQFATNVPCPGTPAVEYEGKVYNTIQIFSQCWLKENLDVGTMIDGTIEQSNNGTIEKYCYDNSTANCNIYGGLYQWGEMMKYTTQQGVQGICPMGWHLPTDEEWKVLEGTVDSLIGIGDPIWDLCWGTCGHNAGLNLKASSGWYLNGNGTDLFGFSAIPGGERQLDGAFWAINFVESWWTSSEYDPDGSWMHGVFYFSPQAERYGDFNKEFGKSVRCLRDY